MSGSLYVNSDFYYFPVFRKMAGIGDKLNGRNRVGEGRGGSAWGRRFSGESFQAIYTREKPSRTFDVSIFAGPASRPSVDAYVKYSRWLFPSIDGFERHLRSAYPMPTLPDPIPTLFVEFRPVFRDIGSYVKMKTT